MSDLEKALEAYDLGEADTHEVSELARAARRFASLTAPETIRSAKLEAALIICDEVYDEFDGEIPLVLQRQADRIVDGVLAVLRSVEEGKR